MQRAYVLVGFFLLLTISCFCWSSMDGSRQWPQRNHRTRLWMTPFQYRRLILHRQQARARLGSKRLKTREPTVHDEIRAKCIRPPAGKKECDSKCIKWLEKVSIFDSKSGQSNYDNVKLEECARWVNTKCLGGLCVETKLNKIASGKSSSIMDDYSKWRTILLNCDTPNGDSCSFPCGQWILEEVGIQNDGGKASQKLAKPLREITKCKLKSSCFGFKDAEKPENKETTDCMRTEVEKIVKDILKSQNIQVPPDFKFDLYAKYKDA